MFRVTFKRMMRGGYHGFVRNGWLSTATIMVMSLVLFVMGMLIFMGALANSVLISLESKIDISVYFKTDASEENILAIKKEVESFSDVKDVSYVSKDAALQSFQDRHQTNALIADALTEIGENPLEASINIHAQNASRYAAISEFLAKKNYPVVEKINYFENQEVIDRLSSIFATVRGFGALIALFLAFIAILVAFNTIRIAIFTMRDEIGIMRLVGAARWFIRGPFVVSGLLYGVVAACVTTLLFFPLTWLVAPKALLLVPNFDMFQYFLKNFFEFFAMMLAAGTTLGVLSSIIATRKYLKI